MCELVEAELSRRVVELSRRVVEETDVCAGGGGTECLWNHLLLRWWNHRLLSLLE